MFQEMPAGFFSNLIKKENQPTFWEVQWHLRDWFWVKLLKTQDKEKIINLASTRAGRGWGVGGYLRHHRNRSITRKTSHRKQRSREKRKRVIGVPVAGVSTQGAERRGKRLQKPARMFVPLRYWLNTILQISLQEAGQRRNTGKEVIRQREINVTRIKKKRKDQNYYYS